MFDAAKYEFLSFPGLLKARPATEGEDRFVYFEASNESRDLQGEVVMCKALEDSADYYLKFGNVDVDHVTQIGAKAGIPGYSGFEIGRPVDVRVKSPSTFVKAQIYTGSGQMAKMANEVWESLTSLNPPARWYPSVGGAVLEKGQVLDPETKAMHTVVRKVRWTNVGLSRTPVNHTVATVGTVPLGALAKSWGAGGLAIDLEKSLDTGGYGTDAAALTGGAALRKQSLDDKVQSYWEFRNRLADDLRTRVCKADPAEMVRHAQERYGLDRDTADRWCERFRYNVSRALQSPGRRL
jgi:hypothetical protein